MMYGDSSRGGNPCAKDPSVIRFGGRYLLYYSVRGDDRKGWAVGIAESTDLDRWTKIGGLGRTSSGPEAGGIAAPGAIVIGDKVHLFYQTYGGSQPPYHAVCHAESADGVSFARHSGNPIIGAKGGWCSGRAIDAEAIVFGGRLFVYYATRDPAMRIQMIGVASADVASDFSAGCWCDHSMEGPLLKPELAWEGDCIEAPAVCRQGDRLFMFYAGAYNCAPQQIGLASSIDGVHFTRLLDHPFLPVGEPGTWNSSESGHPAVFVDPEGGKTHLFFQGCSDGGRSWYISRAELSWRNGMPMIESFHPD